MGYLFGPIISSRLGRSLGVDLIPYKICNYDCIYCECGPTTARVYERGRFVKMDRLLKEFEDYLSDFGEDLFDVVCLTGCGEPTLEIQLGQIIERLRSKISKPLAVLTNGSLMTESEVQNSLGLADIILPSLDAVDPEIFKKIDQAHIGISIEDIILGMADFRRKFPNVLFWLEVLLVAGINDDSRHLEHLRRAIEYIEPHRIHVGTVSRPPAYAQAKGVSRERLAEIEEFLTQGLLPAKDIYSKQFSQDCSYGLGRVVETIKRRPLSLKDIVQMSGLTEASILFQLKPWVETGMIKKMAFSNKTFFAYRGPAKAHLTI